MLFRQRGQVDKRQSGELNEQAVACRIGGSRLGAGIAAEALAQANPIQLNVLGHCGECHTPRNFLGGWKKDRWLAGGRLPDGRVPNLTPTRLKKWNDAQLREFLRSGSTPEGDAPSDSMYEVIRNTTSQLIEQDLDPLIAYLRSLPPLPEEPK